MVFCLGSVYSQFSQINGQKTIGNEFHNFAYSLIMLDDGSYLVLGDTETDTNSMDILISMISDSNTIIWQKTYGGSGVDKPSKIIQLTDDEFLIVGSTSSFDGDIAANHGLYDYWLFKINKAGKLLWEQTYGGSENDFGIDISHRTEACFVAGYSSSNDGDISENKGGSDYWLLKLDEDFQLEWDKNYGGSDNENLKDLLVLENNNILLLGGSNSTDGDVSLNKGEKDVWLVETDENGQLLWEKTYGGSDNEEGKAISKTENGNLIIGTVTKSEDGDISKSFGLNDYWLLGTDSLGQLQWQKSYGGSRNDVLKKVLPTDDGYLLVGNTYSYNGNITENKGRSDVWYLKVYKDGDFNWQTTYGGSGNDNCADVIKAKNSTYLMANYSDSFDYDVEDHIGETDIWMLEICESFLTLDKIDFCSGDSVFWSGNYYSFPGEYLDSFNSQCGLDSLKRLLLTEVETPELPIISGPDWATEFGASTYNVEDIDDLKYYWGIENGSFKDTTNFAHKTALWGGAGYGIISVFSVRDELCKSDTAFKEVYISGVGVEEKTIEESILVFPNPSDKGIFNVEVDAGLRVEKVEVYNFYSKKIYSVTSLGRQFVVDLSNNPEGVYLLHIRVANASLVKRLVLKKR